MDTNATEPIGYRNLDAIIEQGELAKQVNDLLTYVGRNSDELEPLSTELMAILRFATNESFDLLSIRDMSLKIIEGYERDFSGPVAHMEILLGQAHFDNIQTLQTAEESYSDN